MPPPVVLVEAKGGIWAEPGYLRIVNRAYLVPRREFTEPIDLQFEWKWSQLGGDPQYADHLSVAIRTNATPNETFFYEVSDGLIIKFNAWGGYINIQDRLGNSLASTTPPD